MGTVFIVDDDRATGAVLARLIRHAGHETAVAISGADALAQLRRGPVPDLVILDFMMPGMNGLDVLKQLRGDERTARLPVAMYSAIADPAVRADALAAGADDYWVKAGIDFDEICERLRALMAAPAIH